MKECVWAQAHIFHPFILSTDGRVHDADDDDDDSDDDKTSFATSKATNRKRLVRGLLPLRKNASSVFRFGANQTLHVKMFRFQ